MSTSKSDLEQIELPARKAQLTSRQLLTGKKHDPIQHVSLYSPEDFESFICEWATSYLSNKYSKIFRSKGKGDKGRDIAGFVKDEPSSEWDNYQCKHYANSLGPSNVWAELGKHIFYSYSGSFRPARKYYFVAPQGVSNLLQEYFENPAVLKSKLKENWDSSCRTKIRSGEPILMSGEFEQYFEEFDFSIFTSIEVQSIIEQHAQTIWHAPRFGGGLKPRPPAKAPPSNVGRQEQLYTSELLKTYGEREKCSVSLSGLKKFQDHNEHFQRQRRYFYHAESLRQFAKDTLPDNGEFEDLQQQIYDVVISVIESHHKDGLERLNKALASATAAQLSDHVLIDEVKPADRNGICHQLANEGRLKWVKKK